MSGMADSIRERRAREFRKEGVEDDSATFEEEWPEDDEWEDEEWEDEEELEDEEWEEEEEWEESLTEKVLNAIEALMPRLVDFAVDVATMALVPATLMLLAIALFQRTTFEIFETALLVGGATAMTLMIADAKTRLLQRLRFR
jgi:translation elongation factor EF-G